MLVSVQVGRMLEQIGTKETPGLDDWAFALDAIFGPKLQKRLDRLKFEMEECDFFGGVVKGETDRFVVDDYRPHQIESICDERDATLMKVKELADHIRRMHAMREEAAEQSNSQ